MSTDLNLIERGVWPAMLTTFKPDLSVDFDGLSRLTDFYLASGVEGLLGTCWSSETECLTFEEALEINRHVVKRVAGAVPVAATPHAMSVDGVDDLEERIERLFDTGVTYVVLVAARLAQKEQSDERLCERLEALPWSNLGIYESPWPYHRLLSPQAMERIAKSGRFFFHKDTSCNMDSIRAKIDAVRGTSLRFYNANSPTLLESLKAGGNGYCGVGTNFYPEVYVQMCRCVATEPELAARIQDFLNEVETMGGNDTYPANAKAYLQRLGVKIDTATRLPRPLTAHGRALLDQLAERYDALRAVF